MSTENDMEGAGGPNGDPQPMGGGGKIIEGLQDALKGNFTRVEIGDKAWVRIKQSTRHAGNWQAWAIGALNKRGRFHVRRIVWSRALAREEKREGEIIRNATILVSA